MRTSWARFIITICCLGFFGVRAWVPSPLHHSRIARSHVRYQLTASPKPWGRKDNKHAVRIFVATSDDNNDDSERNRNGSKSVGRVGGRSKQAIKKDNRDRNNNNLLWIPAMLLGVLLLKGVLFDSITDPSFVYYESSVFESRVYDSNGHVETSRHESFRSNIPSLMEETKGSNFRRQQQQQDDRGMIEGDDVFQQMNSAMRLQESMLLDEIMRF